MGNDKIISHKDLCYDLAMAKATRYIEVPLGGVWFREIGSNGGNADVVVVKPSYIKFNVDIYEVKVNRSDFLQDIKKEKYKKYLSRCNRLYFAILEGIAEKNDIPKDIGLIVHGKNGWYTAKKALMRDVDIPNDMLLALAFFNGRIYKKRRIDMSQSYYGVSTVNRNQLKGYGKEIKEMILNYNNLKLKFSNLLYDASKKIQFNSEVEREEFRKEWEKISYIYGK